MPRPTPEKKTKREKPLNPEGYLATQDLKERGWTPRLIERFLGPHDLTRENGLKMGRRRLPPVKLYLETRVDEAEREDAFLAAQAKAADARERAAHNRERRLAKRQAVLLSAAESYTPSIHPEPLRKGAKNKARAPYLPELERVQRRLVRELASLKPALSEAETAHLHKLLLEKLDTALSEVYDWFPAPHQPQPKTGSGEAQASDWRTWDWD